jgi:putative transposase
LRRDNDGNVIKFRNGKESLRYQGIELIGGGSGDAAIEELLFERGIVVSYETVRRWCDKFGKGFAHRVKAARHKPGSTWHLDEMFITLRGEPYLLWRAVDEHGPELDVRVQKRRDKAAAKRFFKRVLRSNPVARKIVTDQLRSNRAAKAEIPELANVKHVFVKAAARLNNRAENSHQPTRERERRMRGFRNTKRTQKFLSCFGPIRQHFALKRHLLCASLYRKQLATRFVAWCEITELTQNPLTAF